MARNEDRFANILRAEVVESAANTITFKEILTGISLGAGVGLLIDQINYYLSDAVVALLTADTDALTVGWTITDTLTELVADDASVIDMMEISTQFVTSGTVYVKSPVIHQFFPPIIRATPRLYLAVQGAALPSALTLQSRMFFRYIDLSTQEYVELVETGLAIG